MNDLTTKILEDLDHQIDLMKEDTNMAKGIYLSWAVYWLTGRFQGKDFNANHLLLLHQRDITPEYERCQKALACIYIEINLVGYTFEKTKELMLAERERQAGRGFTIAHDKVMYESGELKYFAAHRITNDLKWFPFQSERHSNAKQPQHSEFDRIVQAAAILLAHLQKSVAKEQFEAFQKAQEKEVA